MQRRILFVTGTRADFGKLKPLMLRVENDSEMECLVFATGMHLLSRYGLTVAEIVRTGFQNVHTFSNQSDIGKAVQDIVVARTILGLSSYVDEVHPDLIVVHGDRAESLAGAVTGALKCIKTAHIEGGELSGTIDEIMRHAITKLSHIHFVSNETACNRLIQMGEDPKSIHIIGSPDIDIMLAGDLPDIQTVKAHYGIKFGKYIILMYHPVVFETDSLHEKMDQILRAIRDSGHNCVAIFPNNDPGADIILQYLDDYATEPWFRPVPSMRFEYFLALLKHADALIGNSSCGIHEAPVFGVPTLNLGTRQKNRSPDDAIVNLNEDYHEILTALKLSGDKVPQSLSFGDGKSAERFMEILRRPDFWSRPVQKQFHDLASIK